MKLYNSRLSPAGIAAIVQAFNASTLQRATLQRALILMLLFCSILPLPTQASDVTAINDTSRNFASDEIFNRAKHRIYQIRIINKASENKASIGSGFQISADGHIATNYHVISDYVQDPEKYLVEYIDTNDKKGPLQVLAIDVVHDLAILQRDAKSSGFLPMGEPALQKGVALFSMGNPHDLGMTLVEGTYNGLIQNSFYQRILFSGSINPGMSGGPTVNQRGEVIGINVATAGNQLSFLVPVDFLQRLYQRAVNNPITDVSNIHGRIETQLLTNENALYNAFLDTEWPSDRIGTAITPGQIAPFFKCWGDSEEQEDDLLYNQVYKACDTEENIYLSDELRTGSIYYQYDWLETEKLNAWQFKSKLSYAYDGARSDNKANKKHVGDYQCNTDYVAINGKDWKSSFCVRSYKHYPSLFDLVYTSVTVDNDKKGLIFTVVASGITKLSTIKLVDRFMEGLEWEQ